MPMIFPFRVKEKEKKDFLGVSYAEHVKEIHYWRFYAERGQWEWRVEKSQKRKFSFLLFLLMPSSGDRGIANQHNVFLSSFDSTSFSAS